MQDNLTLSHSPLSLSRSSFVIPDSRELVKERSRGLSTLCVWQLNCPIVGAVLKTRRSENNGYAIFALSGRIEERNVSELLELIDAEPTPIEVTLDLTEVKLVNREAIRFLAACKARGIRLKNCPPYIRRWIEEGSDKP
jgi:hypothetical protein